MASTTSEDNKSTRPAPYYVKPAKVAAAKRKEREELIKNGGSNSAIIAQFVSQEGLATGNQISLPADSTIDQLNLVLNQLLNQNDDPMPYSFFVDNQELSSTLHADVIIGMNKSTEHLITITFHPQAVFRVRSVTRCSSSLSGHAEAVLVVSFSPDGESLATGSGDCTIRLWDLNTETPKAILKGHTNWVQILAWSPDGKFLASGSMDKTVRLWDPKKGATLGDGLKGHSKPITCIVWEPLHLNPECSRFASTSLDGTIRLWNAKTRQCELTLSGHTLGVTCARWIGEADTAAGNSGGGLLCTGSRDRSIRVWDPRKGVLVRVLEGHGHWVNSLASSCEFATRTGGFDHTGRNFSTSQEASEAAKRRYTTLRGNTPERLASCSDDFTLFLWEPSVSKKAIAQMTGHMQLVNHISFSPDGHYLASASFDKSVKLWDGRKGTFIDTLRGHVGCVYQVSFSTDSRQLVSSSKDSTLKCWDLRTRKLKVDLPGHADEVYAVDWSPGGDKVASGGKDKVVKLWRY